MSLLHILIALSICLASLVSAVAFIAVSNGSSALPALIVWATVSAGIFYLLLCMVLISYSRHSKSNKKRDGHERKKSDFTVSTDSNAGLPLPLERDTTFHWESESFRGENGPRSPATVLHYPLRSSFLRLPVVDFRHLLSSPPMPAFHFDVEPLSSPSPIEDKSSPLPDSRSLTPKCLPASPPLSLDYPAPTILSPISEVLSYCSTPDICEVSVVSVVAMGKAKVLEIGPPPKGRRKSPLPGKEVVRSKERVKTWVEGVNLKRDSVMEVDGRGPLTA